MYFLALASLIRMLLAIAGGRKLGSVLALIENFLIRLGGFDEIAFGLGRESFERSCQSLAHAQIRVADPVQHVQLGRIGGDFFQKRLEAHAQRLLRGRIGDFHLPLKVAGQADKNRDQHLLPLRRLGQMRSSERPSRRGLCRSSPPHCALAGERRDVRPQRRLIRLLGHALHRWLPGRCSRPASARRFWGLPAAATAFAASPVST